MTPARNEEAVNSALMSQIELAHKMAGPDAGKPQIPNRFILP